MAGYSGTPLAKKLGIKPGARVSLVGAPTGFEKTLHGLPEDARVVRGLRGANFDVVLFFTKKESELRKRFAELAGRLTEDGGLWVAWPKKASGVATDVGDAVVRATGLEAGLVDNKVCAVDDTWSGLRFVVRLKDRPKKA